MRFVLRPNDWPLAAKVVGLCTVVAVLLSIGLSSLGYVLSSDGLRTQAEATMGADAQLVTTSIDNWNRTRLDQLQVLATLPAVVEVARQGDGASLQAKAEVSAAFKGLADLAPDVDSVGIMDPSG